MRYSRADWAGRRTGFEALDSDQPLTSRRYVSTISSINVIIPGEFLSEICVSSNVAKHCANFSLSDSNKTCFVSKCDHEHDGKCANCDQVDVTYDVFLYSHHFSSIYSFPIYLRSRKDCSMSPKTLPNIIESSDFMRSSTFPCYTFNRIRLIF